MSMFEQLEALSNAIDETITGDIISTGAQIRIIAGETCHMPVDGIQTWGRFPDIKITRLTLREQAGHGVMSMTVTSRGEQMGIVGGDNEEVLLPCYTMPQFLTFKDWVHLLNLEFQRVNMDVVNNLAEFLRGKGFVNWVPRAMAGQEIRERTTKTLLDIEAPGRSLIDRHKTGVPLSTLTIIPGKRHAPNVIEFINKDKELETRPGFTSFVDTAIVNIQNALTAYKLPEDTEDRADILRASKSRLSVLTGTNGDTTFSTRPTVGYLTIAGVDPTTNKQFEEMNFFPDDGDTDVLVDTSGEVITDVDDMFANPEGE